MASSERESVRPLGVLFPVSASGTIGHEDFKLKLAGRTLPSTEDPPLD